MKKRLFLLLLVSGFLHAAPPAWWSEPETAILIPGKPSSPLSPACQAQLMWTAKQAAKHLDQYLPGGAGPKIHALVESFYATNPNTRLRLVNLAQLKAIGKCYYDRLLEVGYPTKTNLLVHGYSNWAYSYPWNPSTPRSVNLRPCALAQIKAVFSFDLRDVSAPFDGDGLGIPDWWENYYLGGNGYSANSLTAGGVLTLGQAFQGNTNPAVESTAGDGVSDLWKLANGHSATDVVSTLVNGIPDAWLLYYGIDLNTATAEMDNDQGMGDGLSLLDEFRYGTSPNNRDSDGDNVLDGADGWALDAQLSPPRLGEVRYAVIDLVKDGLTAATALSDAGHVLGWKASGTPAFWFQAVVTELPSEDTDSSPLNWSGINASGNAVGWKENDDNISIVPHCLYTYANSTFGTAMESYYEGLPAQNRASGFFVPITTNNGAIYAEVQQAGSSPPATHVGRSGILRVESGSAQELPDYCTLTTVNNPPGPDQLSQTPVNALSMTFPIDANDAGVVIGYAKHYQLQANTIVESNLTSALIEAGAIHDIKDLPGSLPSGFNWAASVSEGPDSLVVGTSSGEFAIWAKRPQWKRIYFPNVGSKISGVPVSVNARAEMVGAGLQSALLGDKGQLIRNGKVLNLSNLNATHAISSAQLINEAGQILAWGKPKSQPNADETPLLLIPFDVLSDLNNDGKITSADQDLRSNAVKAEATASEKEKGTEYLFANDNLSNGIWDKDDSDSNKPQNANEDDDVEELSVTASMQGAVIWFEYPQAAQLAFYKTKGCKPTDKITFPLTLSAQNPLPEKIYARAEGSIITQIEGDLEFKIGKDQNTPWASRKLKLTIVKKLGDAKFFDAARDYIMERNTRHMIFDADFSGKKARLVLMREEATLMKTGDTYWGQNPPKFGIDAVVLASPSASVITNANFTFDKQAVLVSRLMTRRCHGRMIQNGVMNTNVSSDNDDPNIPSPDNPLNPLKGAVFAGETAKYIAMTSDHQFTLAQGRVPLSDVKEALGGFHTDYSNGNPTMVMLGIGKTKLEKRLVFVLQTTNGTGFTQQIAYAAKESGVPSLPGGDSNDLMLILGDGGGSQALAYKTADDQLKTYLIGDKHTSSFPFYCINTYLFFQSELPRPQQQP